MSENNDEDFSMFKEKYEKIDRLIVADMLLSKQSKKTVDSDTMILDTQKRIWNSLKKGIEYDATVDESDTFLRKNVGKKLGMVVMYADLVGSTNMSLSLPEEKVAMVISSFAQEMALAITQHNGFVLKFVGDAVIGYFMGTSELLAADNGVNCAKSMINILEKGIDPILKQYDYPELKVKIGLDYGANMIVRYGSDKEKSHVDILGPAMNMASKIQNMAKAQEIMIGEDVHSRLHPTLQDEFEKQTLTDAQWKYRYRETNKQYPIYLRKN